MLTVETDHRSHQDFRSIGCGGSLSLKKNVNTNTFLDFVLSVTILWRMISECQNLTDSSELILKIKQLCSKKPRYSDCQLFIFFSFCILDSVI